MAKLLLIGVFASDAIVIPQWAPGRRHSGTGVVMMRQFLVVLPVKLAHISKGSGLAFVMCSLNLSQISLNAKSLCQRK